MPYPTASGGTAVVAPPRRCGGILLVVGTEELR